MKITIESKARKDGNVAVELQVMFQKGSDVYQAFVYETSDGENYKETHRSYITGDEKKATIAYHRFCNKYL